MTNSWVGVLRQRWIGLFPLGVFLFTALDYYRRDTLGEIFWVCNISCALLAIAIFADSMNGVWIATLSIVLGVIPWMVDEISHPEFALRSILLHFAGGGLGLIWCQKRVPTKPIFIWAFAFGVTIQIVSHFVTRPDLNVNVSQFPYEGHLPYWQFWTFNAVPWMIGLWGLEKLIRVKMERK